MAQTCARHPVAYGFSFSNTAMKLKYANMTEVNRATTRRGLYGVSVY